MRVSRCFVLVFAACSCGAACDRPAEPPSPAAAGPGELPATSKVASERPAPATAPSAGTPRCVMPMAAEPAPEARKAEACPEDPTGPIEMRHGFVTFVEAPGSPRVEIEIAESDPARERGLMYRTEMPEDRGMIFSWPSESRRSFWMHNTCIPLDMLFIDSEGVIAGVLEQVPVLDESARTVRCPVAHVLELNAGWVRSHDVKPGQRVRIES